MSRHTFGQGPSDWTFTVGTANAATLAGGVTLSFWDNPTSGTQYTDLLDSTGAPITTVLSASGTSGLPVGTIPAFSGPDGVTAMWVDAGGGYRSLIVARDLGAAVTTLQTSTASHAAAANPHGTKFTDLSDVYNPTVAGLLATTPPWYVAHRGSGASYTEHTLEAYRSMLAAGAKAIEVSAHTTADGVPVCHHDTTLDRMTNVSGNLADYTYWLLKQGVKVQGSKLLGPGVADTSLPLLREVLDLLYGKCVIFLEAKSNASIPIIQQMLLERYPGCQRSIVWKNYYQSSSFAWAKTNNFTTWGYLDDSTTDAQLNTYDANVDIWGPTNTTTDSRISAIVARGKPTLVWVVDRRSQRDHFSGLGVQGMMTSDWQYVTGAGPAGSADQFLTSVKAIGNMGPSVYDPTYSLKYDNDGSGGVYINVVPNQAVLLGRLSPGVSPAGTYSIKFDMKFEGIPSDTTLHAGVAFCKPDDTKYGFSTANASGGYHTVIRANGTMQLFKHTAGVTSGTALGTAVTTPAAVANTYMQFQIDVSPTQIVLKRLDSGGPYTQTVADTSFRGGYIHLSVGSVNDLTKKPHFRNVSIV